MGDVSVKRGAKKSKNKFNKVNLVFDEAKRREFLTGFHKRKLQRKKYAKEKLEKELKEERKRLKQEAKESYKKLVVSHRPIPEVENLLKEEYEDDDMTVSVVELSTNDIAKKNNWIGANQPKYESSDDEQEEENEDEDKEEIPGMELKSKSKQKLKVVKEKFESQLQIKRTLKKQATKNVQKSKVFQMKNKLERQKQKKKSMQMKKQRMKIREKNTKKRGRSKPKV
ncbi:nucleolar protein 12 [Aethina tumida]|uniref:nucleolar protein 12 n=1 Tax=Aethina tumida TaxID=116153 RepID=UPI0021490137|nr:nucleolar protein 12 [Aethina tumida]